MAFTGFAIIDKLSIRRRAAFNVAFSDGRQLTINDDDNVQGHDPGTGRSVDAGGCGWTLYNSVGVKIGEDRTGLLAYDNNWLYNNLVFEIPATLKIVQDGPAVADSNPDFYRIKFKGA